MTIDLGFIYAINAFVSFLVILIVLNRSRTTVYRETVDRRYSQLLIFFLGFTLVDGIWGLFFSDVVMINRTGLLLFTYGFHGMAAWSAFMWSGYLVHYMNVTGTEKRLLNITRHALITAQMGLLISNIWTHKAFWISYDMIPRYNTGNLRTIMFLLQFSYYALLTIYALARFGLNKNQRNGTGRSAIVFCLIEVIFGIGQLLLPDGAMYSLGFMFSTVTIYAFNVTAQREKFLAEHYKEETAKLTAIAAGLSDDFEAIYYVDLSTNNYENFRNGVLSSRKAQNEVTTGEDFFRDQLLTLQNATHPDDREMLAAMLSKEHITAELQEKKSFTFNFRMTQNSDLRYYNVKVIRSEQADAEHRVIVGLFDVDDKTKEEMQQQDQLRAARAQAEVANTAKSRFLFNMSHDIRTPMNAIVGFTDMAIRHIDDKESVRNYLQKVSASGTHLLSLINDVLDMARIESGKMVLEEKPSNIREGTDMIVPIIQSMADKKNVRFELRYAELRDETVLCDQLHVNQILINLLSNAVKYTKSGGTVTYTIAQQPDREPGIGTYLYTVQDNGIGMSKEFVEHIFEDFARESTTTKSGVEGTGLGMSIVKQLIDRMGGNIRIESEQGVGTTIYCELSFRKSEELKKADPQAEHEEAERSFAGKRILLVEDNELNREIAKDILEEYEFLVDEAEDGSIAVEIMKNAASGYYDVILMDVQMPIMDGYQATRIIRGMQNGNQNVPIIAMTANAFDEDRQNAVNAGMNDHLAKPIDIAKLTAALKKYL